MPHTGACCRASQIISYSASKKTRKNENKGEPSVCPPCHTAPRLLRKSSWLLTALLSSTFAHITRTGRALSSFNNKEMQRSNVMICSLSHQKALAQFSNKPAQHLTLRPPLVGLLLSQVNAAGVSPGRAGSDRATVASDLPTTHPRSAESETEKLDLDLGIKLAKGMKKKKNASHPGTRLWQYQSLEKKKKTCCAVSCAESSVA